MLKKYMLVCLSLCALVFGVNTALPQGYLEIESLKKQPFNDEKKWNFDQLVKAVEDDLQVHLLFAKPIKAGEENLQYYAPKWSPDGKKLAMIEHTPGKGGIIRIADFESLFPSLAEVAHEESSNDYMFTWEATGSDDGAFARRADTFAESYNICIYKNRQVTEITDQEGMSKNPDWNREKGVFVYQHGAQIYILTNPESTETPVKIEGTQPAISPKPDDVIIAYAKETGDGSQGIFLINPASPGNSVELFSDPGKYADRPVWSPDGKKVAFYVRDKEATRRNIACFQVDSLKNHRKLLPKDAKKGRNVAFNENYEDVTLAWAPDCTTLLFFKDRAGYRHLYWMNVDTGEEQKLDFDPYQAHTLGLDISVHPGTPEKKEGYEITFIASKNGMRGVYVMILNHF